MQQSNSVGFIWPNYATFSGDEKESIPPMNILNETAVSCCGYIWNPIMKIQNNSNVKLIIRINELQSYTNCDYG